MKGGQQRELTVAVTSGHLTEQLQGAIRIDFRSEHCSDGFERPLRFRSMSEHLTRILSE